MANLLITTTPLLEKIEIQRYIGPLTANVVLGVNFFSDLAASITDVFGGNSETYQSKLDNLTSEVNKIMISKASRSGANAIVDYKLQFNEISGKGKQMFMVTATGTACVITEPEQEVVEQIDQISYSQIKHQYLLTLYQQKLKSKGTLSDKDWENIFSLSLVELAPELADEYFRLKTQKSDDFNFVNYREFYCTKFEEFLGILSKPEIASAIYPHLDAIPELVIKFVVKYSLFDSNVVLNQIASGKLSTAIELLRSHKEYYSHDDVTEMDKIIFELNNLPDKGSIQLLKNGLFSKKEEEKYVCQCGHKNSKEIIYCESCGQNIKGLTTNEVNIINHFERLTDALKTLLK